MILRGLTQIHAAGTLFSNMKKETHFDTELIHGDTSDHDFCVNPPIFYSATFKATSEEMFAEMASTIRHPRFYTRYGNPTHERAAKIIASIEGGEAALLTSSGMGAISSTVFGLVGQGDHVVAQTNHYMGTCKMLSDMLLRFGVTTTFVDQTDVEAFRKAITSKTKVIMVETPSNPTMTLTDLSGVAELAKERGILTVCDNTFASPVNQNPIGLGIDVVVHSATKFLGGHHDITAGAIVSSHKLIEKIWFTTVLLGPTLSPMDAWLLLRGLRTLSLRVERQNANAMKVAKFLEKHSRVEKVFYPGLESHPQHRLAQQQMKGFGGVLSFILKGGYKETAEFSSRLKLLSNAVSLGGVDTLFVHAAAMWTGTMNEGQMKRANIHPALIRVSLGLENVDDIVADIDQALRG